MDYSRPCPDGPGPSFDGQHSALDRADHPRILTDGGSHPHGSDSQADGSHPHATRSQGDGTTPHASGSDEDRAHPHASEGSNRAPGRDYSDSPLVVTWEVSQACDLACDHCRAEADPDRSPDELTTAEAIDLFEQVAQFSPQPFLVLSGGDPLKRPDIFDLLQGAVDVGVTPSITPATTPLLDRETIERFADVGVGRMALSLDGATAESHDGFRGETGTFETAIEAAEYASEVGLSTQINTTVTASTADELPQIASLVDSLDAAMWEVFFLVPTGRGEELDQLAPCEARETMEWLYEHSRESPYRVITVEAPFYRRVADDLTPPDETPRVGSTGAGNGFVFVSHTGEVYPSGFLPLRAGNVRETSLPEIYQESTVMRNLRDRGSFDGPCGSCPYTPTCGGSRSRAYATTGNPRASDPLCPWAVDEMDAE